MSSGGASTIGGIAAGGIVAASSSSSSAAVPQVPPPRHHYHHHQAAARKNWKLAASSSDASTSSSSLTSQERSIEEEIDDNRLVIDLDSTSIASGSTTVVNNNNNNSESSGINHQQSPRIKMTTASNHHHQHYQLHNSASIGQLPQQQTGGDYLLQRNNMNSTSSMLENGLNSHASAPNLMAMAAAAAMAVRAPTPRLQHQASTMAPPPPVVSNPSSSTNPYLFQQQYAAAQQLFARAAAAAAVVNGGGSTAAQLFLPNAVVSSTPPTGPNNVGVPQPSTTNNPTMAPPPQPNPYQYLMAAASGFPPQFCLPLNDGQMAAAIANAGLLVPQQALAAQLLCQAAGNQQLQQQQSGLRIQGGLGNNNERRVSAPDIKNLILPGGVGQNLVQQTGMIQQNTNAPVLLHQPSPQRAIVTTASTGPTVTGGGQQQPQQSSTSNSSSSSMAQTADFSDYIQRLISENEAIVEPPPALLKRRSYTKCHQGQSASLDYGSTHSGTTMGGQGVAGAGVNGHSPSSASGGGSSAPSIRPPFGRSNRSQSLIDTPSIAHAVLQRGMKVEDPSHSPVEHQQQQQHRPPPMVDPRLISPKSMVDPRFVDSKVVMDPRLIDPRLLDPKTIEQLRLFDPRLLVDHRLFEQQQKAMAASSSINPIQQQVDHQHHHSRLGESKSIDPQSQSSSSPSKTYSCRYCNTTYRNAGSLRGHEYRCDNRVEHSIESQDGSSMVSPPMRSSIDQQTTTTTPLQQSMAISTPPVQSSSRNGNSDGNSNRHPLKKRILAAAELDGHKVTTTMSNATTSVADIHTEDDNNSPSISLDSMAKSSTMLSISTDDHHQRQISPADHPNKIVLISPTTQSQSQMSPPQQQQRMSSSMKQISPSSSSSNPIHIQPRIQLTPAEQSGRFHPYRLTFKISDVDDSSTQAITSNTSPEFSPPQGSSSSSTSSKSSPTADRVKPQQVTQPTFCCQRKQPIAFTSPTNGQSESAFAVWPQVAVSPLDAKLNIMMMGGCNIRARWTGVKYSTATQDLSSLKITDSTYWERSKRLQQCLQQQAATAATSSGSGVLIVQESPPVVVDVPPPPKPKKEEEDDVGKKEPKDEDQQQSESSMKPPANTTTVTTTTSMDQSSATSSTTVATSTTTSSAISTSTSTTATTTLSVGRQKLKAILTAGNGLFGNAHGFSTRKVQVCNGGYKTNESYTYVRGRGRGRYVCERCGIRCKKPSMLKKHIRSHLNVRPYSCPQCMFSFKTKGNLTKHLKSQAHTKKVREVVGGVRSSSADEDEDDEDGDGKLEIVDSNGNGLNRFDNESDDEDDTEEQDDNDGYSTEDETDENDRCVLRNGENCTAELRRRRYSYKNIWTNVKDGCYPERSIRTPPPSPSCMSQSCVNYTDIFDRCDTAPPALNSEHSSPSPPSSNRAFDGQEINKNSNQSESSGNVEKDEKSMTTCSDDRGEEEDAEDEDDDPPRLAIVTGSISTSSDTENQPGSTTNQQSSPSSSFPAIPLAGPSGQQQQPYFAKEGKCKCEICGKEFMKIGLLRLHMEVHNFVKSGRRYEYKCPHCNSGFRSKSLLQKHLQTAHRELIQQQSASGGAGTSTDKSSTVEIDIGDQPVDRRSISTDDSGEHTTTMTTAVGGGGHSTTMLNTSSSLDKSQLSPSGGGNNNGQSTSSSSSINNPRPFECADCHIAFRIHGHLSKHLRSKLHITKLENMGKLPIGLFARLEDAGNAVIAEIDTSDCPNSLKSLLQLAERFDMMGANNSMNEMAASTTVENNNEIERAAEKSLQSKDVISLACTEEMPPNSPPVIVMTTTSTSMIPVANQVSIAPSISTHHPIDQSITTSINPTPIIATKEVSKLVAAPTPTMIVVDTKPVNGLKAVAADVWIPPTVDKLDEKRLSMTTTSSSIDSDLSEPNVQHKSIAIGSTTMTKSPIASPPGRSTTNANSIGQLQQQATNCQFCGLSLPSSLELEIHLHADHVVMRDGNDFRCPRANCDSVYPNRESLRQHLASHFYGRLDDSASMVGMNSNEASPSTSSSNGGGASGGGACGDVSKSTVAALSRKLGSGLQTTTTNTPAMNGCNNDDGQQQQQLQKRKMMKTHLVKLSSIPESSGNDYQRGIGGGGSTDTSPVSAVCVDSDASRASINSSASPGAESPATMDGSGQGGGRSSSNGGGRQSAKRKSLEDVSMNMAKRIAAAAIAPGQQMLDPQQLMQWQHQHQQQQQAAAAAALFASGTPPQLNGFYQHQQHRVLPPTTPQSSASSIQSQSPIMYQHQQQHGGAMTPNSMGGGWSPSPLYQQYAAVAQAARQQISPPQQQQQQQHMMMMPTTSASPTPLYFAGAAAAAAAAMGASSPMAQFLGLQNSLAMAQQQQAAAAKLFMSTNGMSSFYNQLAASQLLQQHQQQQQQQAQQHSIAITTANPETAAAAMALTQLGGGGGGGGHQNNNEAAAAAALGFFLPPQPCILCGKQFANNSLLQEHLLTHTLAASRPFVCEHCDAGFTTEHALQSHRPCRQQRIDV